VFGSIEKHWRPEQQSPSAVHDCATSLQYGAGGPQTSVAGLHHSAALQHGNDSEHVPPVSAQVGGGPGGATQVPLVLPGSTWQVRGSPVVGSVVQQSALVVQASFFPEHEVPPWVAHWWLVGSQYVEQH
jgi:hypothetical protein